MTDSNFRDWEREFNGKTPMSDEERRRISEVLRGIMAAYDDGTSLPLDGSSVGEITLYGPFGEQYTSEVDRRSAVQGFVDDCVRPIEERAVDGLMDDLGLDSIGDMPWQT